MILIYAYIKKYKNYVEQEISFDSSYFVTFHNKVLSIKYRGMDDTKEFLCGGRKTETLHLIVGKTGSGKTNLLQLIGAKKDVRDKRKWDGEDDAYFLLYKVNDTEFFLEICDVDIAQLPAEEVVEDADIPEIIRDNAKRMDIIRSERIAIRAPLKIGEEVHEFKRIREYGRGIKTSDVKVSDMGIIINSYDINAFIRPPYPDEKEDYDDYDNDWMGRMNLPYHRTTLWQVCDYIRQYLSVVEPGSIKREVSFVLRTDNFAEEYPIKLPNRVEKEYRTFSELKREELLVGIDEEARRYVNQSKQLKSLSNKQMFIHDLWVDYAKYLRKWIEKIHSYGERVDYRALPDGKKMSITKRCAALARYIDKKDSGNPKGIVCQAMRDVRDIIKFLEQLDDKYFSVNTFSIPVVDMVLPEYKVLFEDLFERMEQYHPDDAGIFTSKILPYEFTHLSSGEHQYAKVLGGVEEYLKISYSDRRKPDKIILLDEPEAYMHPELARQFIARLYEIIEKYQSTSTVQIIIGTHSPFMMSDVLPEQITRLDIDKVTGNAIVKNGSEKEYFGANIHTILADSFFLDYTIGEYSRKFLQDTYKKLVQYTQTTDLENEETQKFIASVQAMLPYIGDSLIRRGFEILLEQITREEE